MKFKYKITIILCCILLGTTGIISGIWYSYSKEMIVDNAFKVSKVDNRIYGISNHRIR